MFIVKLPQILFFVLLYSGCKDIFLVFEKIYLKLLTMQYFTTVLHEDCLLSAVLRKVLKTFTCK